MSDVSVAPLTMTDAAVERISSLLASENSAEQLRLRIEVRPGGCQGMNYDLYFDDKVEELDHVFPFGDFEAVVDQGSFSMINGSTIDYEDTLTKQGLVIENPNATSTCACGESFC